MNDDPATERTDQRANEPSSGPPITIYRLQACPYCERVVRKLNELDLDYHSRFVETMHSERTWSSGSPASGPYRPSSRGSS